MAKLSPDASQTIWWTPLDDDRALALALGPGGSAYVAGETQSMDFPTTSGAMATSGNAFEATPGAVAGATSIFQDGYESAFLMELDPTGTTAVLAIAGFGGNQIALDVQGNIYAAERS